MLLCDIRTYFYLVYLHCRLVTSFLLFKSWRELLKTKSMWPLCSQEKKGCYLLYQVPLLQVALRFVWNIICSDLWQKNEVKTSYWCKKTWVGCWQKGADSEKLINNHEPLYLVIIFLIPVTPMVDSGVMW